MYAMISELVSLRTKAENGLDEAQKFIIDKIVKPIVREGDYLIDENFKSQLLEFAQANKMEGIGKNKKSAEQKAAKDALKKLNNFES